MERTVWRTESNRTTQRVAVTAMVAVGALLVYACRPGSGEHGRTAGLLLGVFLLLLGAGTGLFAGVYTVTVDPTARTIVAERRSRLGTKTEVVRFDDVARVGVQTLAGRSGGFPSYYVSLRRHDGRRVALFVGFFDGSFSRGAMEERCRRLERYLDEGTAFRSR